MSQSSEIGLQRLRPSFWKSQIIIPPDIQCTAPVRGRPRQNFLTAISSEVSGFDRNSTIYLAVMTYYWSVTETDRETNGGTGGESRCSALMNVRGRAITINKVSYSRLTGYGIPWVMIALSRATTGLPSCNAQRTSSETRNTESGRKRSEIH